MTERIIGQVERFAPGFRDVVLATHVASPSWFEQYDPNNVGGDIAGGPRGLQLTLRPRPGIHPSARPTRACSSARRPTPPGGGVHGMCGANAAESALATTLR